MTVLYTEDVPRGTVVRVDGVLIPKVYECDVLCGIVRAYKEVDGKFVTQKDGDDIARIELKGQITIEFPEPAHGI